MELKLLYYVIKYFVLQVFVHTSIGVLLGHNDIKKKRAAARKKELTRTGGGTADIAEADEILMLVESIMKGAINPVKCDFDSF